MNRRDAVLGLVALNVGGIPFMVRAQQPARLARVGFLGFARKAVSVGVVDAFLLGMQGLGYVAGKNLLFEWRTAEGDPTRLPALAAELVRLNVEVILAGTEQTVAGAQKATNTIPIIAAGGDLFGSGLVKSLARPEGNITGLSNLNVDISAKVLQLLLTTVSALSRVGVLLVPSNAGHAKALKNLQSASQALHVNLLPQEVRNAVEIENAFSRMTKDSIGGVIVSSDAFLFSQRRQLAELSLRHRIPSITNLREYVEAGCLLSYGRNINDSYRRAATYVDRILKGAKPADLPVEQASKLELVVNLKTAKMLELTIPQELLLRADGVIE